MDPNEEKPKKPQLSWFWWVLLIGLIVWNVISFWPQGQPVANIPYSTFTSEVNSGNVANVTINGSSITGTFTKSINFPSSSQSGSTTQAYTQFSTNFPTDVGDPTLIPLLNAHNVQINVTAPASPLLSILLTDGLPVLLLVLVLVWIGRQTSRSQSGIFNFGHSKARQYNINHPTVTFKDIAGADEAKNELSEIVDFLRRPQKYHKIGARIPRGVLLVGPPGTGKTLMARAVAGEAGVPFSNISASEFVEMFVGVGASRVRDLFEKAKAMAPAIVFIDELDAVGRRRGAGVGNVNDEREQTLNQLLVEMDGFDEHHEVIVMAATNRPDVLDPALLRPGRFDRQIVVGLPDRKGREGILKIHTAPLSLNPDVDLGLLSQTTTGFSGADLANLCNEAALIAAGKNHDRISMVDFEEALDKVLLGAARTLLLNDEERRTVAYHESGHALVAWLTPEADPVHKVTIIPRGRALGVTEQLPGEDHYNYSKDYLLSRLAVMLGGRAAEETVLNAITTGAENDLVEATRLARRMVTRWGMGSIGLMVSSTNEEQPFLGYELAQQRDISEETAARIDRDVQRLLNDRYTEVQHLIEENRTKLDKLVEVLLKEETIDQTIIEEILGKRVFALDQGILQPVESTAQ
ncbi:MAG: ATP-dependent zinc metalloprotease FtsH [Chloroflexi bacterium]|nr:ATP-dependent zinc metalloprotease FtsH [Chloroflexota bacterium]